MDHWLYKNVVTGAINTKNGFIAEYLEYYESHGLEPVGPVWHYAMQGIEMLINWGTLKRYQGN